MSINSTSTEKQKFQSRYSTLIHLENRGLTIFKFQKSVWIEGLSAPLSLKIKSYNNNYSPVKKKNIANSPNLAYI